MCCPQGSPMEEGLGHPSSEQWVGSAEASAVLFSAQCCFLHVSHSYCHWGLPESKSQSQSLFLWQLDPRVSFYLHGSLRPGPITTLTLSRTEPFKQTCQAPGLHWHSACCFLFFSTGSVPKLSHIKLFLVLQVLAQISFPQWGLFFPDSVQIVTFPKASLYCILLYFLHSPNTNWKYLAYLLSYWLSPSLEYKFLLGQNFIYLIHPWISNTQKIVWHIVSPL